MEPLQQTKRLAELSALYFTEDEWLRMQKELMQMLNFLSALPEVDQKPMPSCDQGLQMPAEPNACSVEQLLYNAPERYDGFYRIPDRKAVQADV